MCCSHVIKANNYSNNPEMPALTHFYLVLNIEIELYQVNEVFEPGEKAAHGFVSDLVIAENQGGINYAK